jgi:hypothetical protein
MANPRYGHFKFIVSCHKKIRYQHSQTAENAVRSMEAKYGEPMNKYLCKFCSGWHVGHK